MKRNHLPVRIPIPIFADNLNDASTKGWFVRYDVPEIRPLIETLLALKGIAGKYVFVGRGFVGLHKNSLVSSSNGFREYIL